MRAIRVGDVVRGSSAILDRVEDGNLWYSVAFDTDDGPERLMFPVPMADTAGGNFRSKERPLYLMRWIRPQVAKHNELYVLKTNWDGNKTEETSGTTVHNCARCTQNHNNIEFEPLVIPMTLKEPPDWTWTHWFSCPVSGQPVMVILGGDPVLTEDIVDGTEHS